MRLSQTLARLLLLGGWIWTRDEQLQTIEKVTRRTRRLAVVDQPAGHR